MIDSHRFLTRKLILAMAALTVGVAESAAQGGADLTGTWVLAVEKSNFGMTRPPESEELEVRRADTQLVLSAIMTLGDGDSRERNLDIPVDGGQHEVETEQGPGLASAEWVEGKLVVWRTALATLRRGDEVDEVEIELTDRYSLLDSGDLQILRSVTLPDGPAMSQTLVYQRGS